MTRRSGFLRLAALAVCALLLSGCVPAPYGVYYEPSYPHASAKPLRAACGGQAGPPSRLEFELAGDFVVQLDARRATADPPEVVLAWTPRKGERLQFARDTVSVTHDSRESPSPASLSVVTQSVLSPHARVDPAEHSAVAGTLAELAHDGRVASVTLHTELRASMAGGRPGTLRLQWPAVRWADGTTTVIPAVDLEAESGRPGWVRYISREEKRQLRTRFEQCRARTPERNCQFILDSYENGFTVAAGAVELRGRVLVTDPKSARVDAYLSISLARATPWRWTSLDVVLTDVTAARSVAMPVAPMRLVVSHRDLPLSTKLGIPASGSTTVRVNVPLRPAGASVYSMRLPDLGVGAQTVRPMPIRLERRAFDGGIEPFNC